MLTWELATALLVLVLAIHSASAIRLDFGILQGTVSHDKSSHAAFSQDHGASLSYDGRVSFVPSIGQRSGNKLNARPSKEQQLPSGFRAYTAFDVLNNSQLNDDLSNVFLPVRGIGSTRYGDVKEVIWQGDAQGEHYAMKTVSPELPTVRNKAKLRRFLDREIRMQQLVDSDHTVKLYKAFKELDGDVVMVMELMPDGSLLDKIAFGGGLKYGLDIRDTFRQIVDGVKSCHDHDVVHLDLKPQNIWFKGKTLKVGDFGFAREAKNRTTKMREIRGTRMYRAPETFWSHGQSSVLDLKAVDVWALGVTFYKVLTRTFPWKYYLASKQSLQDWLAKIAEAGELRSDYYTPLPWNVDKDLNDLVTHMLDPNPQRRYTIQQVADHKYFQTHSKEVGSSEIDFLTGWRKSLVLGS
jgi:serine/threonine protein kinase